MPLVHGAITILFGALLVAVPDQTLTFVATVAGFSLVAAGLVNWAQLFQHRREGRERFATFLVGLLAAGVVAGRRFDAVVDDSGMAGS